MRNEGACLQLGKNLKRESEIYGNHIEISVIRNNQFRVFRSLKLGRMVIFGNFARIASLHVGFRLGALRCCFFHSDFWPNVNFLLEHQIKLILTSFMTEVGKDPGKSCIKVRQLLVRHPLHDYLLTC